MPNPDFYPSYQVVEFEGLYYVARAELDEEDGLPVLDKPVYRSADKEDAEAQRDMFNEGLP
jgi:hypothetical protein